MCNLTTRHTIAAHLLCTTLMATTLAPRPSAGQIYLNPVQQNMNRSRVSIDMGDGLRCTSDGGSVPTLSLSMGAYPDQWGSDVTVFDKTTGSQSSLLGLVSLHVPLGGTSQKFDCNALLKDAKIRARLDNLRELVDENIISDAQYRSAVLQLYQPILKESQDADPAASKTTASKRLHISDQKHQPTKNSTPAIALSTPSTDATSSSQWRAIAPPPALPPLPNSRENNTPSNPWESQQIAKQSLGNAGLTSVGPAKPD